MADEKAMEFFQKLKTERFASWEKMFDQLAARDGVEIVDLWDGNCPGFDVANGQKMPHAWQRKRRKSNQFGMILVIRAHAHKSALVITTSDNIFSTALRVICLGTLGAVSHAPLSATRDMIYSIMVAQTIIVIVMRKMNARFASTQNNTLVLILTRPKETDQPLRDMARRLVLALLEVLVRPGLLLDSTFHSGAQRSPQMESLNSAHDVSVLVDLAPGPQLLSVL